MLLSSVWHPNVSSVTGAICLDILKDQWSPALTIKTAMLSLQALMVKCNDDGDDDDGDDDNNDDDDDDVKVKVKQVVSEVMINTITIISTVFTGAE